MTKLSAVTNSSNTTSVPMTGIAYGKYSYSIPSIMNKVSRFAMGCLIIYALENIPKASAGGTAYLECVRGCTNGNSNPWAALICGTICTPLLLIPS